MKLMILSGLALMFHVSVASSEPVTDLLAKFDSMSASFEQTVYDDTGRLIESSEGDFQLLSPHFMRWIYRTPFEQQIIADGERVWLYDVELEQVTVKSQTEATNQSPLYVLTNPESLEERFNVEEVAAGPSHKTLQLTPKSEQADFERIELAFTEGVLSALNIHDAFGQRTLIGFHQVQYDVEISDQDFQFSPPEDIDVIAADELLDFSN